MFLIQQRSDSTSTVTEGFFCELARRPHHAEKVYNELQDVDVKEAKQLAKLQHLDGVISEALRLYPAMPTAGTRMTSNEELTIGETYIPLHTRVVTPRYTIHRRKAPKLTSNHGSTKLISS